jgi:CheY-like chemotaxis protein
MPNSSLNVDLRHLRAKRDKAKCAKWPRNGCRMPDSAVRALPATDEDIEVVGEASNGCEAAEVPRKLHPDVVIMDDSMPVLNGSPYRIESCRGRFSVNNHLSSRIIPP